MAAKKLTWLAATTSAGNARTIKAAAKRTGMSVSRFIVTAALKAAERTKVTA